MSDAAVDEPADTDVGPDERRAGATIALPFNGGVVIPVAVDPALVANPREHSAELFGLGGYVATVVDTYATAPALLPAGGAGEECFLRVVNIASKEELLCRHIASAALGISVGDPVLSWHDGGSRLTVHLTSEPEVTIAIEAWGAAHVVG